MAGQKFQYDENGGTFFYFVLSLLALILVPITYYFFPRYHRKDSKRVDELCHCENCNKKSILIGNKESQKGSKQVVIQLLIVAGWMILGLLAWRVSQYDYEYAKFDPYEILGISLNASEAEIRKSYRKLSLVLHPDKETGNAEAFVKLTKAYRALMDDEARENWERYGNPDGPATMSFGIALPSWIVEKENSVWVLGLYALVFMVALPTGVGIWWYNSIQFTGDEVLLITTRLYQYFYINKPSMNLKRVIMILTASFEFEKSHNPEVIVRPTDYEEVMRVSKQIPDLSKKTVERPFSLPYSIKARTLLYAHLSRIPLIPQTLDLDRQLIVKKCPYLIQEMVNCISMIYAQGVPRVPPIDTLENCMELSAMVVQAMWNKKSPLLQLPYITEDNLKYFHLKKKPIKKIQQFARLGNEERRSILRHLTNEQYNNVMKVVGKMPDIDMIVQAEVIDDENPTVYTAGAVVTVTVTLTRKNLGELFNACPPKDAECDLMESSTQDGQGSSEHVENDDNNDLKEELCVKKFVWQKQQKKSKKNNKKGSRTKKSVNVPIKTIEQENSQREGQGEKDRKNLSGSGDGSHLSSRDSGYFTEPVSARDEKVSPLEDDDDNEWEKFQSQLPRRNKVLESRRKQSHIVHCPFFPEDKQEFWWIYIADYKTHRLMALPYHVTALVEEEKIKLKFLAPKKPKCYTFTVCLRSDSYLGFDQYRTLKLDVKEAPEVPTEHPQWNMLEDDGKDEESAESDQSDFTTDEDFDENES